MHAGSVLRLLRAGAFAAVCVMLAALGHAMTSGRTVPGWMLAVGWAGTAGVAWFLTGKERGPLLVGALTVFTQPPCTRVLAGPGHEDPGSRTGRTLAGHGAPRRTCRGPPD